MAASSDSRTLHDYETSFLEILKNESKFQTSADISKRTHGFVVVVRGGSNLKPLQNLCVEEVVSSRNSCITARYRLQPSAGVGTLLFAFLSDLYRLSRAHEARLAKGELTSKIEPLAGDLLPVPFSDVWTDKTWVTLMEFYLERLMHAELELASQLRESHVQGVLRPEQVNNLLARFDDETAVLRSGDRLVLFAEFSEEVNNPHEWEPALQMLLERLPERVGIVFSGLPKDIRLKLPDNDPHFLELSLPIVDGTDSPSLFTYKFTDSSFHSDVPAEKDDLGVNEYAKALARFILHPQTKPPLTVGIHGPWGKGKSSFINLIDRALVKFAETNREARTQQLTDLDGKIDQIEAELHAGTQIDEQKKQELAAELSEAQESKNALWQEMVDAAKRNVLSVRFNAWQFEDAKQTWAGLASVISEHMERLLTRRARQWLKLKYAWHSRRSDLILNLFVPMALALVVLGLFVFGFVKGIGVPKSGSGFLGLLQLLLPAGSTIITFWFVFSQFLKVVQPVSERVLSYGRLPNYRDQMGFQHRVKADLKFVYEFVTSHTTTDVFGGSRQFRVVVYIDDLDRCSENKIMEILQAINLILADCNFFVFVGMDTDMIYRAINSYYKEAVSDRFANNYLSKIIQISFHLPEIKPQTRSGYLATLFSLNSRLELAGRSKSRTGITDMAAVKAAESAGNALAYDLTQVLKIVPVQLKEAEDTADELQAFSEYNDFIDDNPREIKRLINIHRLLKILVQQPNTTWSVERQKKLVKWLIFCDIWPHLVGNAIEPSGNGASENYLLDLVKDIKEKKKTTPTADVPQFDRLEEFAKFVPKPESGEALSDEERDALIKAHALSSEDIDDDFRQAAKLSQMVRKRPQPPIPETPPENPTRFRI